MMWGKQKKLERLFDELRGIAVLERLGEYFTKEGLAEPTEAGLDAHLMRQARQSELMQEILRLTPEQLRRQ